MKVVFSEENETIKVVLSEENETMQPVSSVKKQESSIVMNADRSCKLLTNCIM